MSFGEYLKQLRKNMSISQRELAEKSGVSNAEISRIETGGRQKISPDVLRAIAPILEIPYEELMDKAGYINSRSSIMTEHREAEELFIATVTPKLIMDGWSVERTKRASFAGDIVAKKGKEEWHIDYRFFRTREDNDKHFRYDMRTRELLWRTYGRLAIYDKDDITKYTIAVSNDKIYEIVLKYPPRLLRLKVTAMFIDLEEGKIIDERILNA
ncbi:helix-turn-helix domain-containing protein [Neobacillus drentensis]|uniref:helix-turn-helix domain-containing protein n=1 Tax=Neobacillus drentensis TaxID=220684 RepID=UPI00285FA7C0|nr:helix-turn-helix domain-containing protein [Neobacillus drentensis]MDR7238770.1 transcriptional regulator with XRE-family HTH domain [Neobacillus drentensis]